MTVEVEQILSSMVKGNISTRSFDQTMAVLNHSYRNKAYINFQRPNIARFSSSCNYRGFRIDLLPSYGSGHFECVLLDEQCMLSITDCNLNQSHPYQLVDSDLLVIGVRMRSKTSKEDMIYKPGCNAIIGGQRKDCVNAQTIPGGTPIKLLSIYLPLNTATPLFGMELPALSAELQHVRDQLQQQQRSYTHFHDNNLALRTLNDMTTSHCQGQLRYEYLNNKVRELLCYFEQTCGESNSEPDTIYRYTHNDQRALETARNLIEKHYKTRLLETDIAQQVGLSRTRLRVFFEEQYGQSIHDFIVQLRIEKAMQLLKETDLSISEIASSVGYSDSSGFRKAFTRLTGMTPKEVKKA